MKRAIIILWIAGLLGAGAASAQTIRSTLTGTVTDPNGAVIQGAVLTATNTATGVTTSAKSNQDGLYTFTALQPGEYVLEVEVPGFKRFVQGGIVLQIAESTRLDPALEVGAVT
jgi:hypothetical protein